MRRSQRARAKVTVADSSSQYSMSDATISVRFKPEAEQDGLPALGTVGGSEDAPLLDAGSPLHARTGTTTWEQTLSTPQSQPRGANANVATSETHARPVFADTPPPDAAGIGRYDDTV